MGSGIGATLCSSHGMSIGCVVTGPGVLLGLVCGVGCIGMGTGRVVPCVFDLSNRPVYVHGHIV